MPQAACQRCKTDAHHKHVSLVSSVTVDLIIERVRDIVNAYTGKEAFDPQAPLEIALPNTIVEQSVGEPLVQDVGELASQSGVTIPSDFSFCQAVDEWKAELKLMEALEQELNASDTNVIEAVDTKWEEAFARGKYKSFNLESSPFAEATSKSALIALYKSLRQKEVHVIPKENADNGLLGSSLVFMGGGGRARTPFHVDWSEARNIGFGVKGLTNLHRPIATWVFVKPEGFNAVRQFLIEEFTDAFDGQREGGKTPLSRKACIEKLLERFPQFVKMLEQHVGTVVYVPPQWMHAVFTTQRSIKLAWDFVNPANFLAYAKVWRDQKCAALDTSKDFVQFMSILVKYLTSGHWRLA